MPFTGVQVGEKKADHSRVLRSERDDVTPRTTWTTQVPDRPGADMLLQVSAALAASARVLKETTGSHQLAHRAESTAKDLFAEALKSPGMHAASHLVEQNCWLVLLLPA